RSIDAAMSSLPEMYAMFPMIAVQRYLGESAADALRRSQVAGHIPRSRPLALLLHLWSRRTLRRSHGRAVFAGASVHARMGPPTRRESRSPRGNRRDRLASGKTGKGYQEPPSVNQNGHAKGWVTKARQSLGVLSTAIGIDLLNVIRAGIFLAAYVILEWVSFIHEYKGLPITPWNPGLGAV